MIDIQRFGQNGVAANNVQLDVLTKMSRISSTSRIPLQVRNPNSQPHSLSGSSEGSLNKETPATRLSTLESSNNENNKARINNSSSLLVRRLSTNSLGYPVEVGSDNGDSSVVTHTGAASGGVNLKPHRSMPVDYLTKTTQLPGSAQIPSSLPSNVSQVETDENVVVEEKRRKTNGDGYTIHRYLRGRLLGKGGFAKVYLCTALDTNKNYAVKIVPKANLVKTRARQKVILYFRSNMSTVLFETFPHSFPLYSFKQRSRFIVTSSTNTYVNTNISSRTEITVIFY
jgi:hypothetical protein